MTPERLTPGLAAVDSLSGVDAVCCFLTDDERPLPGAPGFIDWRLCGGLSRVLRGGFFQGLPGERLLVPSAGQLPAPKLFAVGLGRQAAVTALGLEHALGQAAEMLVKAQVTSVALAFATLPRGVDALRDELLGRSFTPRFPGRLLVFA